MGNVNSCGISPRQVNGLAYTASPFSLIPVINLQHNPTTNDRNFPLFTFARNGDPNDADFGAIWYLQQFEGQTGGEPNAIWVQLSGSSGPVIDFAVPAGTSPVVPDATGTVTYTSSAGTLAITGGTNSINFDLTGGGVAVDSFTVPSGTSPVVPNSSGNIAITVGSGITVTGGLNTYQIGLTGGGIAIDSINVDTSSGSGTDPVVPDSNGQITVTGGQIATGTIGANVIRSISTSANSYTMQIQQTDCVGAKDTTKNGVAHFNSAQFTDDEGFISSIGNFRTMAVQVFTANGTYTPTSGMKYCIAEALGGGGGGGGVALTGAGQVAAGGGGGAGGYARKVFSAATIGASQAVTIGAAGAGGVGAANGSDGGNTTLGALLTGNGGTGGGLCAAAATATALGGLGGNGGSGDVNVSGSFGGNALAIFSAAGSIVFSGAGANSQYGRGGGGSAYITPQSANGNAAASYGAGGAGAVNTESQGTARNGGAGVAGIIIITEFI